MRVPIDASLSSRLHLRVEFSSTIQTQTLTSALMTKIKRRELRTLTTSTCYLPRIVTKNLLTVCKSSKKRIPITQLHSLLSRPQLAKLGQLKEQKKVQLEGCLQLRVILHQENQPQPQKPKEVCGHQHAAQKKIAKDRGMLMVLPSQSLILPESKIIVIQKKDLSPVMVMIARVI